MGVDLGLVRLPCTCTMSYYYATHRMEFFGFSLSKSIGIYAVLVNFRWFSTPNAACCFKNDYPDDHGPGSSCYGSVKDS